MFLALHLSMSLSLCLCFKRFMVYCHIISEDDQQQLVKILVLDIILMKPKYVAHNTLYFDLR